MNFLILGSGGFIGSSLVKKLAEDVSNNIIAYQRKAPFPMEERENVKYIVDDFCNINKYFNRLEETDVIIHAISSLLPVSTGFHSEVVNVISPTAAMLDHFKDSGKYFIFISSGGSVYELKNNKALSENMPLKAYNLYGLSKIHLEEIFLFYQRMFSMNVCIVRPSNVFGYRNRNIGVNGIISTLISNTLLNIPTEIWGDGNAVRDYISIDDFTTTLCKIVFKKLTGVYNLSSGNAKSVNELICLVNKYAPQKCKIVFKENLYHLPEYIVLDNQKLYSELPPEEHIDFEIQIQDLIKNYSDSYKITDSPKTV